MSRKFWNQLPKFMRKHQTVRADLISYDDPYWAARREKNQDYEERSIDEANLITSIDSSGWGGTHRPVLDLDMDAVLIPSSTKGHWHLLIDHPMPYSDYIKLLDVMAEVGLLQKGFVDCSKDRGATAIRLPWINKDNLRDNAFDPALYDLHTEERIEKLEAELKALKEQAKREDDLFKMAMGPIKTP